MLSEQQQKSMAQNRCGRSDQSSRWSSASRRVLWDDDGGSHRPKGREHKYFGFFDRDRGIALRADLGITKSTRYTPRHKHDCESVRYIIRGKVKYEHVL